MVSTDSEQMPMTAEDNVQWTLRKYLLVNYQHMGLRPDWNP